MNVFEAKKILTFKTLLLFLLLNAGFSCIFYIQNRGVEKAKNTKMLISLYDEVGGEITEERAKKIENIKEKTDFVLGMEYDMEKQYNEGKISVDEYMKYRDDYHFAYNRYDAVDLVYERYTKNQKKGWWMLFDGYYNQLFQPARNQWGLILSVFLLAVLLSCCESPELSMVLSITRKGTTGIWLEKLQTILVFSIALTMIYGIEEYGIMASFAQIQYLDAPVQSISCLSKVRFSVSIGEWILLTTGIRILMVSLFSGLMCTILYFVKNKKIGIFILASAIFIPMIISEVLQLDKYNIVAKLITVYSLFA